MATILNGTALANDLSVVRSKDSGIAAFRAAVRRVGLHLAVETSRHLPAAESETLTPLERTQTAVIEGNVILVPVLRAGLGLLDPFLDILPDAEVGFVGLRRNEDSLLPTEYYRRFPDSDELTTFIIIDPMLATGGSLLATIDIVSDLPHHSVMASCLIAAPEGIDRVESAHPEVRLTIASVDSHLNDVGFIVPGLGDAGDRLFGT